MHSIPKHIRNLTAAEYITLEKGTQSQARRRQRLCVSALWRAVKTDSKRAPQGMSEELYEELQEF
jgi:hypothetical protein